MADPLCHPALLTDLYELTMAAAYFDNDFRAKASFELFIRSLPPERSYLVAAGLEQALDYLENVRFQASDIEYLRSRPVFRNVSSNFFEYLRSFRFQGEVWTVREGTPIFSEEPLLRVTAPIIEAQVVETYLLSIITFQTMIASKAARVVGAAQGRAVVEFGTRRAHGPEAGTLAARAAYIAGCIGTSNVDAGRRFDIPVFGTLAHSFIMAYEDEEEAFQRFEEVFPENATLLIDTYDTLAAIDKIVEAGLRPQMVRLDSGNLIELSREVRRRLDERGLRETRIFATSDLDEHVITEMLARGAQVDAFGVGTSLATSKDAPTLSGVYKLVDVYGREGPSYRAKLSGGKVSYPGCKQVYRRMGPDGKYKEDVVARCADSYTDASPLLDCVMREGKRLKPSPRLADVQQYAGSEIAKVPESCRRLHNAAPYPVRFSGKLQELLEEFRNRVAPTGGKSARS
ncbi:MAG TPA: nicotinate phosphoribosyltransferase [Terriglobales bacterium]|nr:nicotinate phosphoribosyltransferase [Terriglobales bacterium]